MRSDVAQWAALKNGASGYWAMQPVFANASPIFYFQR